MLTTGSDIPGPRRAVRRQPSRLADAMAVQISPSILNADFARLADEAAAVESAADWLHVDVMDNHFVPNLTIGLPVVESLLKAVALPIDCHLMIEDPDSHAPAYAEAGARSVTIHAEAARAPVRTLRAIRAAGARAGLAINPSTPVEPCADLPRRVRHAAADDGRARLRRPEVPRPGPAEDPSRPRDGRRGRVRRTSGSRSMAASATRPSSGARRRAPTCSSPGPRSTARRTRRGPRSCCASRPSGRPSGPAGAARPARCHRPATPPGRAADHARQRRSERADQQVDDLVARADGQRGGQRAEQGHAEMHGHALAGRQRPR